MDAFYEITLPEKKCCRVGYEFNSNFDCILGALDNDTYEILDHSNQTVRELDYKCNANDSMVFSQTVDNSTVNLCSDVMFNGTEFFAKCIDNESNHPSNHPAGMTTIYMWGAQTYMTTNIAHVILCTIIVVIYYFVPELGKNVYNRAVLRHYISLLCLGIVLNTVGFCDLYQLNLDTKYVSCLWLTLQFFTLSTVFWLNVICYDMTLVITGFRWLKDQYEDNKKLQIYGIFAWGFALCAVIFAGIFEFAPGLPPDFVLKPKYYEYRGHRRMAVNYYFFFLPVLTLVFNNALFLYTSYKIIKISRSTEIATKNQSHALKKNYLMFLRLYLLMGAPWFFGCFFAFLYNELIGLKFCRVLQPALWIVILMSDSKLRKIICNKLCRKQNQQQPSSNETQRPSVDSTQISIQ